MIVKDFGHFGQFGTASNRSPGKDCPAKGSWEDYCDCMFEPGSDAWKKCRSSWPLAPWTIVGGLIGSTGATGAIKDAVTSIVSGGSSEDSSGANAWQSRVSRYAPTMAPNGAQGSSGMVVMGGGGGAPVQPAVPLSKYAAIGGAAIAAYFLFFHR